MLPRSDLERIAQTVAPGNVGQAETLYLQDLLLSTISRETTDSLVVNGGTALLKFYQLDRFSEDLDFSATEGVAFDSLVDAIARDYDNYGVEVAERTTELSGDSFSARFGLEGPLYTGDRRSLCFVRFEANTERSVRAVETRRYTPPFTDIRSFELAVLPEAEILAEKIRALMTRRQPRDLYDIYHLLTKAVPIEPALIRDKLDYYDIEFERTAVIDRAEAVGPAWESLTALTFSEPPAHQEVVELLERSLT